MSVHRWLTRVWLGIRSIAFGAQVDRELDDELQCHIDQQIDAHVAAGMSPEEARRAALRAFGGVEQRKEECRDTRRVSWLLDAARDGRHAMRLLVRNPMFAMAAVLSLGIGIAANTAIFSVVDALVLASLGLFGLLSYRVARRTNEIGVRLAFGATRASVLALVLKESGRLVIAGVIVGVIAALSLSRLVASRLYRVSANDPWTIAGAAAALTIVACLAALIPARQASTVDPSVALRSD
jgi:hypothetical protein